MGKKTRKRIVKLKRKELSIDRFEYISVLLQPSGVDSQINQQITISVRLIVFLFLFTKGSTQQPAI